MKPLEFSAGAPTSYLMPEWLDIVLERLQVLERWDYFTLAINAVIFLTAPWLATRYGTIKNEASKNTRLRTLHCFNFIVFSSFLLAVIVKVPIPRAQEFSQTCLLVLMTYLLPINSDTVTRTN